jgi:hypothetical protein
VGGDRVEEVGHGAQELKLIVDLDGREIVVLIADPGANGALEQSELLEDFVKRHAFGAATTA